MVWTEVGDSTHGLGWLSVDVSAGKMPTGPTGKMPVLQAEYLAKGGDAFLVLIHGADGNADPFR